ncbi:MAG: Ig-like domain-containing protein [Clostridiaceae bacterium]
MKRYLLRYPAFVLAVAVIMTLIVFVPANAADGTSLVVNSTVNGSINSGQKIWYDLIVPADGSISFSLTASKQYFYLDMYLCNTEMYQYNVSNSSHDKWVISNRAIGASSAAEMSFDHLRAGRYYVLLRGVPSDFPGVVDTSQFGLTCNFAPALLDSDIEPNDTIETALEISTDYTGTGHISYEEGYDTETDFYDWYKVTTSSKGTLNIRFEAVPGQYGDIYELKVFKSGATKETDCLSLDFTGGTGTVTERSLANLTPGTYYIKLKGWFKYYSSYKLSVSFDGVPVPATAVTLPETMTTYVGAKFTITPVLAPADSTEKTFTWSSSNSNAAIIDAKGNISAVGRGTAVITVKTGNGKTDTCTLSVEPTVKAATTRSAVLVNGVKTSFDAYNINGYNYFKLRDLAYVVSGTQKQFEVGWDGMNNAIQLTSGSPYTPVGGEMGISSGALTAEATATTSKIYIDGKQVSFTAFMINGNNYFKLRDIAAAFDIGVTWDGNTNTIGIDTSIGYTAP